MVEAWPNQIANLLCLANEKVEVAEGEAASIAIWMVVEYKELDDFVNDATKVGVDAYIVGFTNCRKKEAKAFLALDLNKILELKEEEEVEEGEVAK